ncbi:MAG: BTAD domain-containing putative transcriptional regulator [Acidimicrobiia bacterium]
MDGKRLYLMGGFELRDRDGTLVDLPAASQRVLAFLALQERQVSRSILAGTLWPETNESRAGANLRSALWRLRQPGTELVRTTSTHLSLEADVWVDVRESALAARALIEGSGDGAATPDHRQFGGELLPDLWDAWLVVERERLRQLHLHALEQLSEVLAGRGRHAQSVLAAMAAVEMDPLRESANRVLIQAYLAEGNRVEAIRRFDAYRTILHDELRLLPSAELIRLVGVDAPVMPG